MKTCDFCGKQAEDAETHDLGDLGRERSQATYCDTCSREHLRAIEGKLDSEWW